MDELQESQPIDASIVAKKKLDAVGLNVYGPSFNGYHKVAEYKDLLPAFKDWYYDKKIKNSKETLTNIMQSFNTEVCMPMNRMFHPPIHGIGIWRAKWDLDLMQQIRGTDIVLSNKRNIYEVIKTRDNERNLVLGQVTDSELEAGVKTLGGELINDAMQMLQDDQQLEEIYDDETLMKRRSYIVNVFAHTTRLVHGKAALMLKASEEKRNTAGFLMNLLARASAGQMTDEEMDLLKQSYATPDVRTQEQHPQVQL